eukprot:TRINITY_DN1044_c0_g1_i11.p1 TRINITY_DN1044_c0_g1~~TRINITY_DN1044_c0_g1_i11.p1  ORF type:complete len:524 (+),score=124.10 TRINITY_DN1044_c0_g1_i11:973-2544(+)
MIGHLTWRYEHSCKYLVAETADEEQFAESVRLAVLNACLAWARQPPEIVSRWPDAVVLLGEFCSSQKLRPEHEKWGYTIKNLLRKEIFTILCTTDVTSKMPLAQQEQKPETDGKGNAAETVDPMLQLLLQATVMQLMAPNCTKDQLETFWRAHVPLKKVQSGIWKLRCFSGEDATVIAKERFCLNDDQVIDIANQLLEDGKIHSCKAKYSHPFSNQKKANYYFEKTKEDLFPTPLLPKVVEEANYVCFTDLHPIEIARQLALIEHELVSSISIYELSHKAWEKPELAEKQAPNVAKYISWSNRVSLWVASEIVTTPHLGKRISTVSRFIHIADQSRTYGNWNGVFEVMTGLQMASVARLKHTWHGISSADHTLFDGLLMDVSTDANYAAYRARLAVLEPPLVPYVAVWLRDLFFVEENALYLASNSSSGLNDDVKLVSYFKLDLLGKVFGSLLQSRALPFAFKHIDVVSHYLTVDPVMLADPKQRHAASLLCEAAQVNSPSPAVTPTQARRAGLLRTISNRLM